MGDDESFRGEKDRKKREEDPLGFDDVTDDVMFCFPHLFLHV